MKPVLSTMTSRKSQSRIEYGALGVSLTRVKIAKDKRSLVYKHNLNTSMLDITNDNFSMSKSISIVPPGGYVRIHNQRIQSVGEWPGCLECIGGGIQPHGDVILEAIRDSELLCVAPGAKAFFGSRVLSHLKLVDGETYTFSAGDIGAVVMVGSHMCHMGLLVSPGDQYTAAGDTVLAVIKSKESQNV